MNQDIDNEFAKKIAKNLEEDIAISSDVLKDDLLAMRVKALDALPNNASIDKRNSNWHFQIISGGLITASLMAFAIYLGVLNESENGFEPLSEMEFIVENEEIEMLEEDIEFYLWLEAELDKA